MTSRLSLAAAMAVLLAGCNGTTDPVGVPIDCETLATSLTAAAPTLTTTASGLKYRDVTAGAGTAVTSGTSVAVHYSGCLTSGAKFDQSTVGNPPLVFTAGGTGVIAGFSEGVIGMRPGGRRQLVIPPSLGYGASGSGPIPPNATTVFTVDFIGPQ